MVISRSSRSIKKSTIDKTISQLKKLPPKQKEVFGLRDAIYTMYADIQSVIGKGYSFDEVADLLSQGGIEIKGITLKQYLADYRRKAKKGISSKTKKAVVKAIEDSESSAVVATDEGVDRQDKETEPDRQSLETRKGSKSSSVSDGFVDMPDDL